MNRLYQSLILIFIIINLIFLNCQESSDRNKIQAISMDSTVHYSSNLHREELANVLNVAVAAMISPKETFHYYEDLFKYLGEKLGRKITFKQRKTYKEVNGLIRDKKIDFAFICSGAYVDALNSFPVEILAVPVVNGETFYQAYLIVHRDSPFNSLDDLKGKSFAFTDPLSNTGYLYVNNLLEQKGYTPSNFFSKTIFTYAHDYSIQAVARKIVDGASIDGLIFEYIKSHKPKLVDQVKVISRSEKFGIPPIVTHSDTPKELKEEIKKVLLNMHKDSTGVEILKQLHIDYFTEADPSIYEGVIKMKQILSNK